MIIWGVRHAYESGELPFPSTASLGNPLRLETSLIFYLDMSELFNQGRLIELCWKQVQISSGQWAEWEVTPMFSCMHGILSDTSTGSCSQGWYSMAGSLYHIAVQEAARQSFLLVNWKECCIRTGIMVDPELCSVPPPKKKIKGVSWLIGALPKSCLRGSRTHPNLDPPGTNCLSIVPHFFFKPFTLIKVHNIKKSLHPSLPPENSHHMPPN